MEEKYTDEVIKRALGRDQAGSAEVCPDRNRLNSYLESRLSSDERAVFENHAAHCAACRQVLALAMSLEEATAADAPVPSYSSRKLLFKFSIPVSALALIVAGVAVGVLVLRSRKSPDTAPQTARTAELREPVKSTPSQELRSADKLSLSAPVAAPKPSPARVTGGKGSAAGEGKKDRQDQTLASMAETIGGATAAQPQTADLPTAKSVILRAEESKPAKDALAAGAGQLEVAEPSAPKSEKMLQAADVRTEFAQARNEEISARQALQSRGGGGGVTGGVVGGAVGGILPATVPSIQKASALSALPAPKDAILQLMKERAPPEKDRSRKIGERSFRLISGYWIDEQCTKVADAAILEIWAGAAEFEQILKSYPDLRGLRPVIICWNEKIWVLMP